MGTDPAADSSGELTWAVDRLIGHDLDGRYRIEGLLGKGGMGAVLRARHLFMDQGVAIKVLRPTLARDPNAARRFVREARGTLKVDSEHALKVLDFAITADGLLYMVLELLDGRTVGAEVGGDGPMAARRAVHVARQVCDALAAAHHVGLVHRDLKPDNIMLVRRGGDPDFAKVLDFGLAKVMEGAGERALSMAALTQGDLVFGTPDYMAPEQAMGQPLDGRTDLYALGATLFEMLTARPPFVGPGPMAVLADHVRTPAPRVRDVRPETDAPPELEALIARCLAKDAALRPPSAAALGAELAALEDRLAGRPARAVSHGETVDLPARAVADAVGAVPPARPAAAPAPPPTVVPAPVDDDEPLPRRSHTLAFVLGGALLAAVAVVALALGRSPRARIAAADGGAGTGASMSASRSPSISPSMDASMSAAAGPPIDAGAGPVAAPVAATDAATAAGPSGPPDRSDRGAARAAELARKLDAADAARRGGKRLKQIAYAHEALEIDPRNQRARYLLGDALVATGDQANGCKYLRSATRIAAARELVRSAACPVD
ncbi:MAG TPA: protein kinase [Kofleriaceae bacterium]|nr:protein kinase [Kofleriaceae bacterium]